MESTSLRLTPKSCRHRNMTRLSHVCRLGSPGPTHVIPPPTPAGPRFEGPRSRSTRLINRPTLGASVDVPRVLCGSRRVGGCRAVVVWWGGAADAESAGLSRRRPPDAGRRPSTTARHGARLVLGGGGPGRHEAAGADSPALLIRGFKVRVSGGAPVLTRTFRVLVSSSDHVWAGLRPSWASVT
jgi:hypothetical protein